MLPFFTLFPAAMAAASVPVNVDAPFTMVRPVASQSVFTVPLLMDAELCVSDREPDPVWLIVIPSASHKSMAGTLVSSKYICAVVVAIFTLNVDVPFVALNPLVESRLIVHPDPLITSSGLVILTAAEIVAVASSELSPAPCG